MPATIVETNTKKFKRKDIDPITLDIIENAMMNARYEMDAVVFGQPCRQGYVNKTICSR